jgi:hypothetical protein
MALKTIAAVWLAAVVLLLWWSQPATFAARFEPAVAHPLHSLARAGYCQPKRCLVG